MANWLDDMVAWIKSGGTKIMYDINHNRSGIAGPNNPAGEGGVDLFANPGTPVFALGTGPIMAVDLLEQGGSRSGGVISQRVNVPGMGLQDIYYQHLDVNQNLLKQCSWGNCNVMVQAGQQIGTVGSIQETEVGFNSTWGNAWGTVSQHLPGAQWSTDPEAEIAALMGSGGGSGQVCTLPNNPTGIDQIKYTACLIQNGLGPTYNQAVQSSWPPQIAQIATWIQDPNHWIRIGLVAGGSLIVLIGLAAFLKSSS